MIQVRLKVFNVNTFQMLKLLCFSFNSSFDRYMYDEHKVRAECNLFVVIFIYLLVDCDYCQAFGLLIGCGGGI